MSSENQGTQPSVRDGTRAVVETAVAPPPGRLGSMHLALRVVGAGLLFATGGIHLDLYLTGYRTIPTIGWLFLLQVISALGLGTVVLAFGNRLASVAGASLVLGTITGYLLAVRVALFGFREVRTTAGIVAGIIEVVALAVLALLALRPPTLMSASAPVVWSVSAGLTAMAAVLLVLALAANGPASTTGSSSGAALIKVTKIEGVAVLTNARGFTLYWFVPDTSAKSTCFGVCAAYWPPVIGRAVAGPGVTGQLGTIKRSGDQTQDTYDGHPLYTYVGDSAPGQAKGNNINLNGGLWHEMTVSGS